MLQGKNVIITGTNRGIGKAMLRVFAENRAGIWAHARKETLEFVSHLEGLSRQFDVEIRPVFFDLTDYDAMKKAIMEIRASKIPIDGLVNNAGITYNALFQMSAEVNLREQFEVNFFSVFILTQHVLRLMIRQKNGSIVNIASSAAIDGNPGKSVYGASKAAIICMTKSIASEVGESGIRANCIAPGITETDMLATMPEDVVLDAKSTADLRRGGLPSEIADAAVFLASDLSSYVTGQVIRVDGGLA